MHQNMPILDDKYSEILPDRGFRRKCAYIYKCTLPAMKIPATPMQRSLAEIVSVESVRFA